MHDFLWVLVPILLLPVAAASGWLVARRAYKPSAPGPTSPLQSDYFRGINYLLNEQPDKAIEAFIKVLEVDSETVETHLALGNLYRRRGEVDRAIRIHQNLIARPTLSVEQRHEALFELGCDYMSAGLLDRAESLFQELCETALFGVQALRQVMDIYEQEKDWDKAIATARRLERATGDRQGAVLAHYYCEKAELAHRRGDTGAALHNTAAALESDSACVRASLLEGDILCADARHDAAISAYMRVESQDPDFLPEIVEKLGECCLHAGRRQYLMSYLNDLLNRHEGVTATLALAAMKTDEEGPPAAIGFIKERLRTHPSVRTLDRLLELELDVAGEAPQDHLIIFKDLTSRLIQSKPDYQCEHCGFPAKSLHWQCPACKHWNSIKPIHGIEGE